MAARKKAAPKTEVETQIVDPDEVKVTEPAEQVASLARWPQVDLRAADQGYVAGPGVKPLQRLLGVTADGRAGRRTRGALWSLQTRNGITADYIFGPETAAAAFREMD